jgi:hypothetical protein
MILDVDKLMYGIDEVSINIKYITAVPFRNHRV